METDLTNNEKIDPNTLPEIYNEPLFFNASCITHNPSEYLMKIPPPWAREHFQTMEDICKKNAPGFISTGELLRINAKKIFRYEPKPKDLIELIKLIPETWKQKIQIEYSRAEEPKTKVEHITLNEKWRIAEVNTLKCKDFYSTIHFQKIVPMYQNRKFLKWEENNANPLTQKQWNNLFINLYTNTTQKDSFNVRYRFLHFGQATAIKLNEIREGNTDTTCPRCGEQEESHEHWMFSCPSSRSILIYLQAILQKTYIDFPTQNTATDCLLKPLLLKNDTFPVAFELYEIYFIYIRDFRKDATYGTLTSRKKQIITFQDNVKDRLNFLYKAAALEHKLKPFLAKWNKIITRER